MEILKGLVSIALVALPIIIWAYMFSYFEGTEFHMRKFILGAFAGALGVLPIAYSAEIFLYFGISPFIGILGQGAPVIDFVTSFVSSWAVPLGLLLCGLFCVYSRDVWKMRRAIVYVGGGGLVLVSMLSCVLAFIPVIGSGSLSIQGTVITTLSGIVLTYLFVASLEEALKHFSTYATVTPIGVSEQMVILASIYSALGFVFLENLLYVTGVASIHGVASGAYIGTLISRSIISLLLHVFAVLIFARSFAKFLSCMDFSSGLRLFGAFLLATGIHAVFNIALTYEKTWIIFIYAIVMYFFMTKLFYDERPMIRSLEA